MNVWLIAAYALLAGTALQQGVEAVRDLARPDSAGMVAAEHVWAFLFLSCATLCFTIGLRHGQG